MTDRDALIARLRDGLKVLLLRVDNYPTHDRDCDGGDDAPCGCLMIRPRDFVEQMIEDADALATPPPALDMNEAAEHFRKGWEAGNAAATSDRWRAGRGEIHTCPTCGPECVC